MSGTSSYISSWSTDLPAELISSICTRLDSRLSIIRFRSVCRTWRTNCPLPTHHNILSPIFPHALNSKSQHFTAHTVYLIQPNNQNPSHKPWLAFVDEVNPGKLVLRYPLSKYRVYRYPENFPKVINLLDFRVVQVGKSSSLGWFYRNNYSGQLALSCYWNKGCDKVVVFPESDRDCSLAVVRQCGSLEIYNLEDKDWFGLCEDSELKFDDVVNYKGKIFGIDRKCRTHTVDYESFEIVQVAACVSKLARRRKRLVVSDDGNGLFLVVMDNDLDDDVVRLRAYKLNEDKGKWVEVTSLDDQVFFIGSDCSFSISARMCSGFQGNCIYAFRNSFRRYNYKMNEDRRECLIKDPSYHKFGVFHLGEVGSFGPMESVDVLWPPPSWLAPNSCASGCSM